MTDVCRAMGVRTDVPFNQLTDAEKEIVYHGPAEKKHIFYKAKNTPEAGELDFTYYNAVCPRPPAPPVCGAYRWPMPARCRWPS